MKKILKASNISKLINVFIKFKFVFFVSLMRPVRLGRYTGGFGRTSDRTYAAPQEPVTHRGVSGIWGRPLVENGAGESRERPGVSDLRSRHVSNRGAPQGACNLGGPPRAREKRPRESFVAIADKGDYFLTTFAYL